MINRFIKAKCRRIEAQMDYLNVWAKFLCNNYCPIRDHLNITKVLRVESAIC